MMGKAVCCEPHILLDSLRPPICLQDPQELQTGFSHLISLNTSSYGHVINKLATVSPRVMYKYFKDFFPWKNADRSTEDRI